MKNVTGTLQNRHNPLNTLYAVLFVIFLLIFIPIIVSIINSQQELSQRTVEEEKDEISLDVLERKLIEEQFIANQFIANKKKNEILQSCFEETRLLLPDSDNLYGWATENIYEATRKIGIQLIDYHEVYKAARSNSPYQPYTLEIICESSYEKIIQFIKKIEENPLARITRLDMKGKDNPPYTIKAILQVEWPTRLRWKDIEK